MTFELVEIEDLSDGRCRIYSVIPEAAEETVLETFCSAYEASSPGEVQDLLDRLYYFGHARGADERFFKLWEGRPGDGVCALYDIPEAHLRLYCVRFGSGILIVGGGGTKPANIRTWEEDDSLSRAARQMMEVSAAMTRAIREHELTIDIFDGLRGRTKLNTDHGID